MNPELLYWMLLAHSSSLKPAERLAVIRAANGPLEAFARSEMAALPEGLRDRLRAVWAEVAREGFLLERLQGQDIRVVVGSDPLYPARLKQALKATTPLLLYTVGDPALLGAKRTVAIIGSRDADGEVLEVTRRASSHFAREGYVVVSGYAKGVDQAAFEGAVGRGKTVAVLPQGMLDKSSQSAVRRHTGAVNSGQVLFVSELHPQSAWEARFAMMRNRIVTGLADVVVVAQTGLKETVVAGKRKQSGTWNAAQTAREQGGRVFVLDLPLEGNQALIRAGLAEALPVTPGDAMFHRVEDAAAGLTAPAPPEAIPPATDAPHDPPPDAERERIWRELEDPANRPRLLALLRSVLEELSPELAAQTQAASRPKGRKKTRAEVGQSPLLPPEQ